jgi:hypothetical protein
MQAPGRACTLIVVGIVIGVVIVLAQCLGAVLEQSESTVGAHF